MHTYNFSQILNLRKDIGDKEKEIEMLLRSKPKEENDDMSSILKDQIEDLKHKLTNATQLSATFQIKLTDIERENHRLRGELSCFDMDFFEELEDLKFKYAEAKRRLGNVLTP